MTNDRDFILQMIRQWQNDSEFKGDFTCLQIKPTQIAGYGDFPSDCPPELFKILVRCGINKPYRHQAVMILQIKTINEE